MDRIIISELCIYTYLGVTEEERSYPQRVVFDLRIGIPPWKKGEKEGEIERTICYSTVKRETVEFVKARSWILLEELVLEIITLIFTRFSLAEEVYVQARKFVVPDTSWTGIEMIRLRSDFI